jgi:hypothetical protein
MSIAVSGATIAWKSARHPCLLLAGIHQQPIFTFLTRLSQQEESAGREG